MKSVTLSSKNQVVIPLAVRKKLGIRSGDRLIIEQLTDKEVILKKEPSYYDLIGIVPAQKKDPVMRIRELRDNWR
jgi:AbrB family transcriptional regulator, transcriptional pleiotropic regulator of transition state genes